MSALTQSNCASLPKTSAESKVLRNRPRNNSQNNHSNSPKGKQRTSPLRYPGGKSRAVQYILPYIPDRASELCSPFFGGGSIELACADRGIRVYGSDIFEPLALFWHWALRSPERLASRVEDFYPLEKAQFYSLQKEYVGLRDSFDRAAIFFVLNRSSYSGTTLSGGMSPGHKRFTRSAIERLRNFSAGHVQVVQSDYRSAMQKHPNAFLYLDPPYLNGQKLYGHRGSTHEGFDHIDLRNMLHKRDGWLLSYNDCSTVREWYSDYRIVQPQWQYGIANKAASKEVLILSQDIASDSKHFLLSIGEI